MLMQQRNFERVAHRGAKREFTENTLPAFERAIERGADAIELDVHATADGVVVVHHDPALGTAVVGAAPGSRLDAMTWSELQGVELSPGITIPSLSQVLDLVGGRAIVYVELKGEAVEEATIEAIRHSATRCHLHSFHHAAIARAAKLAPEIPRGLLYDDHAVDGAVERMQAMGATTLWPEWRLVDRPLVDRVRAIGGRVIAWTVNTRANAVRLLEAGVHGLCSDDLRVLAE